MKFDSFQKASSSSISNCFCVRSSSVCLFKSILQEDYIEICFLTIFSLVAYGFILYKVYELYFRIECSFKNSFSCCQCFVLFTKMFLMGLCQKMFSRTFALRARGFV